MLNIDIIACLNDNYSYLLQDKETNTVAIVDPADFNPCNHEIEKKYKKLDYILNTHHHFDHVNGNQELKKNMGQKFLVLRKTRLVYLVSTKVWRKMKILKLVIYFLK